MNALQFECVKVALKQDRTGYVLTVSVHPDEVPEELLRDFVGARYGVAMVRIQDNETATPYNNRVKKAGMICRDSAFRLWLRDQCNFESVRVEGDAVEALYKICNIQSRTELNGNHDAQQKFDEMVENYERWKEKSEPF
jgi:hypothetical protein